MTASAPQSIAFSIWGPITRDDLPGLCERVCALLSRPGVDVALCDVSGVEPDAVTVDALARLQLAAGRRGCQVRLRHASDDLCALVIFMGLRDVLPELRGDGGVT
jgi:ABC-type transporter Mla MlaB component